MWQGWVIAGVNSIIICAIGVRTAQLGFVPANLFCIAIYAHNISAWRGGGNLIDLAPWRRLLQARLDKALHPGGGPQASKS
jgi:hypothetical protein